MKVHAPDTIQAARGDDDRLRTFLQTSSITDFLERHEEAGTPNEFTITGLGDVKVTLGELRTLVRLAKKNGS